MSANDQDFWTAFAAADFTAPAEGQVDEAAPLVQQWPDLTDFLAADLDNELGLPEPMPLAFPDDWASQQPAGAPQPAFQMPETPLGGPAPPLAALATGPPHHHPGAYLTLQDGWAPPLPPQAEAPLVPEGPPYQWTNGMYPGAAALLGPVADFTPPEVGLPLAAPLPPAAYHHAAPATLAPPPQQAAGLREFPHVCPLLRDDNTPCTYRAEDKRRSGHLPAIKDHIKRAHPWHYVPTVGAKAEDLMRMMSPLGAQTAEDRDKRVAWARAELQKGTGAKLHMALWRDIVEGRR